MEGSKSLDSDAWSRLHEIRLRGMVDASGDLIEQSLVEVGHVMVRGSRCVITPQGRQVHTGWARLEAGSDVEIVARRAYESFQEHDLQVKRITTDWQMAATNARPEGYSHEEWDIIDRLKAVHERFGAVLARLARAVPRFGGYRPRLRQALEKLESGERQWLSGLTCDSYHTVWWLLHEDLLVALALTRSEDPNQ